MHHLPHARGILTLGHSPNRAHLSKTSSECWHRLRYRSPFKCMLVSRSSVDHSACFSFSSIFVVYSRVRVYHKDFNPRSSVLFPFDTMLASYGTPFKSTQPTRLPSSMVVRCLASLSYIPPSTDLLDHHRPLLFVHRHCLGRLSCTCIGCDLCFLATTFYLLGSPLVLRHKLPSHYNKCGGLRTLQSTAFVVPGFVTSTLCPLLSSLTSASSLPPSIT